MGKTLTFTFQKLPVMIPAVMHKEIRFEATPLIIKPEATRFEPTITILRQPNFSTRYAEIGPIQSSIPIWVEATMEAVARPVPNVIMNSPRNMPNE